MVGRVGYAPTTPAMSMQYSTIELTAPKTIYYHFYLFFSKTFVSLEQANIIEKLIQNIVKLKSEKNEPLGKKGIKLIMTYMNAPN